MQFTRICSRCNRGMPKGKLDFPWMNDKTKPEWCQICILDISEDLFESIDWASIEKEVVAEANDTC